MPMPPHVLPPGDVRDWIPVADHPETKSAGLGYAVLRALGAHEDLPDEALYVPREPVPPMCLKS